jgi:dolichol-phosphate mannosyltransferase
MRAADGFGLLERARPAVLAAEPPVISVIIPTFNERENVEIVARKVHEALDGYAHEIVFVDDDSTDGTLDVLRELTLRDPLVRRIHRIKRRGLSSAVVEGMCSTTAPYVAVMDADLQHDEEILRVMLEEISRGDCDVVVGSRYVPGGGIGDWDKSRARMSSIATLLAGTVMRSECSDPMSGFFLITRDAIDQSVRNLSGQGYKILLDLCASSKAPLRIKEVPYQFRARQYGASKLDSLVIWQYFMLLADKAVGHVIPARFLSFAVIGGAGVFVHMTVLSALMAGQIGFQAAQSAATLVALVFNFFVNNELTYSDRRLKGLWPVTKGLLSFAAACSLGAVANVGIAGYLFADRDYRWWLAGIAGILVGAVWNFAATSVVTWRK